MKYKISQKQTRRIVVWSFFTFVFVTQTMAQFAGPDKKIMKLPDNSQTVTIGMPDDNPNSCYEWRKNNEVIGNKPVITVNPKDSVSIYNVKRVTQKGVEEDQVKVEMGDKFSIESVTTTKKCWKKGDEIKKTDFTIVTNPTGQEGFVEIDASTSTAAVSNPLEQVAEMDVKFNAKTNGTINDTKTYTIKVVNGDASINSNVKIKEFDVVGEVLEGFNKTGTKIEGYLKASPLKLPCSFEAPKTSIELKATLVKECCKEIYDKGSNTLTGAVKTGLKCDFPLVGYKVVEAGVTAGVEFGIALSGSLTISKCEGAEVCLEGTATSVLNIGIYVQAWSEDVARASVTATGELTVGGFKICYPTGAKFGAICLGAKGNLKMTFLSFDVVDEEITLIERTCLAGGF